MYQQLLINPNTFNKTSKQTMVETYVVIGPKASPTVRNSIYNSEDTKNRYSQRLQGARVGSQDIEDTWKYIINTTIASTTITYPEEMRFALEDIDDLSKGETTTEGVVIGAPYLYKRSRDMSRNVDFGVYLRENVDLWLGKDVYKATVLVNGKKQEYMYNKKKVETDSEGNWILNANKGDYLFNVNGRNTSDSSERAGNEFYKEEEKGGHIYTREVRKSDYLYDGSDVGTTDVKNLQVFVTYRIAVKNQSQAINAKVNEIVDYYDSSMYEYVQNATITKNNTFVGDKKETKTSELGVSTSSVCNKGEDNYNIVGTNHYEPLYLTGIKSYRSGSDILEPGEMTYVFITFKVKNDSNGKILLDQDGVGKKNIAEINGYSTIYRADKTGDSNVNRYKAGDPAGLVDIDSNAGSLRPKDLDHNGNIISSDNSWENRLEDDTDKAPNVKLQIKQDEGDMRTFSGYVFEDTRNNTVSSAIIGDGYDNGEQRINGVKVELVELVQNVDSEGFGTGVYEKEHIWSSITYNNSWGIAGNDSSRYYTGIGHSKVILSGPGIFAVNQTTGLGRGEYKFDSFPAGDFFIRFTYGDGSQTVLTNGSNEVNDLINMKGLNDKTYTGQDYKSTIYQRNLNQGTSYNGITGFTRPNTQNYNRDNVNDKDAMYYYDIDVSNGQNVSDAKDVYSYREDEIRYSSGSSATDGSGSSLKNHRAEVLTSGTKLTTEARMKKDTDSSQAVNSQKSALQELVDNTKMVAQTGVINTEIEYNRQLTDNQDNSATNSNPYAIADIALGLVERPEAQVLLSKELVNIQIRLANGQILFDTNQTVNNLYYGRHYNYSNIYNGYRLNKDLHNVQRPNRAEELVYATMDEELISGATIRLEYRVSVDNIGEVDYDSKEFYYRGNPSGNVITTNVKQIVDYVTNEINYDSRYQNSGTNWRIDTRGNLVSDDKDYRLINDMYTPNLNTFNVLLTTRDLEGELVPRLYNEAGSHKETSLVLSTLISGTVANKNLIYTNLVEVVESSNKAGRRMELSVSGNQPMPYQSENQTQDESTEWFTPSEIDADSSQKVRVGVPTGENKDYVTPACIVLAVLSIVGAGALIIRSKILKK